MLSVFGTCLAQAWLVPPAHAGVPCLAGWLTRWRLASMAVAVVLFAAWLGLVGLALAGSVAGIADVATGTLFGRLVLAQVALLVLPVLMRAHPWLATALAGLAVVLQAGHGHAWAMAGGPSWLVLSGTVHGLAAGAWLGGLVPLAMVVASAPAPLVSRAAIRFGHLGLVCVLALGGSALCQGGVLVGSAQNLTGTDYGHVVLLKMAGFGVLIALAARHRARLTPALTGSYPGVARRSLTRSIVAEATIGLLVVCAAGLLSSLPPALHTMPG